MAILNESDERKQLFLNESFDVQKFIYCSEFTVNVYIRRIDSKTHNSNNWIHDDEMVAIIWMAARNRQIMIHRSKSKCNLLGSRMEDFRIIKTQTHSSHSSRFLRCHKFKCTTPWKWTILSTQSVIIQTNAPRFWAIIRNYLSERQCNANNDN